MMQIDQQMDNRKIINLSDRSADKVIGDELDNDFNTSIGDLSRNNAVSFFLNVVLKLLVNAFGVLSTIYFYH